jgi:predicted outer membrane repeat protein
VLWAVPANDDNNPVTQETTGGWGTWSQGSGFKTLEAMRDQVTVDFLNNMGVGPSTEVYKGSAYAPIFAWQEDEFGAGKHPVAPDTPAPDTPGGISTSYPDTDDPDMIFVDGTIGGSPSGTGTKQDPYNTVGAGLLALSSTRNVVYIRGGVTLNTNITLTSAVTGAMIKRSSTFDGYLFTINGGEPVDVGNIIVDGNKSSFQGLPNPTVTDSLFRVNQGGLLRISGSGALLQNNYANYGGAIYIREGTADMTAGVIAGNESGINGGGVVVYENGLFSMSGGSITDNTANGGGDGGGVAAYNDGRAVISGGVISGNHASSGGGVMSGSGGDVTISGSAAISDNTAGTGAGVATSSNGSTIRARLLISGGVVGGATAADANVSSSTGGGVYVNYGSDVSMTGGYIQGNTSGANGGGLALSGTVNYPITFSHTGGYITGNTSTTMGGGIYTSDFATYTLDGGTITNNTAATNGGGIYAGGLSGSYVDIRSGVITGNNASSGDAIFEYGNTFRIAPETGAPFQISGVILLRGSNMRVSLGATVANITGTLTLLAYAADEDVVMVRGDGYTISRVSDLGKFEYATSGWQLELDSASNEIYLALPNITQDTTEDDGLANPDDPGEPEPSDPSDPDDPGEPEPSDPDESDDPGEPELTEPAAE